jgi:hypothetical protein
MLFEFSEKQQKCVGGKVLSFSLSLLLTLSCSLSLPSSKKIFPLARSHFAEKL